MNAEIVAKPTQNSLENKLVPEMNIIAIAKTDVSRKRVVFTRSRQSFRRSHRISN